MIVYPRRVMFAIFMEKFKSLSKGLTMDKQHVVRVNNNEVHTSEQKSFV